jgi:hypothetical protein
MITLISANTVWVLDDILSVVLKTENPSRGYSGISFSEDGTIVIYDYTRIWTLNPFSGNQWTLIEPREPIVSLSFFSGNLTVLTQDHRVLHMDPVSGQIVQTVVLKSAVLQFNQLHGRYALSMDNHSLHVIDITTDKTIMVHNDESNTIQSAKFSPDYERLCVHSRENMDSFLIRVIHIESLTTITLCRIPGILDAYRFSVDGLSVYAITRDQEFIEIVDSGEKRRFPIGVRGQTSFTFSVLDEHRIVLLWDSFVQIVDTENTTNGGSTGQVLEFPKAYFVHAMNSPIILM